MIFVRGLVLVLGQVFLGTSAQEEQLFERLKRDLQQFSKHIFFSKNGDDKFTQMNSAYALSVSNIQLVETTED